MNKLLYGFLLALTLGMLSCSGSGEKPVKEAQDSVKGSQPLDSIEVIRNPDENLDGETNVESEENNETPLTPQEP